MDAFLVRDGVEGQALPGEGRGGQVSRGRKGEGSGAGLNVAF